jgi:hypothetical protein
MIEISDLFRLITEFMLEEEESDEEEIDDEEEGDP